MVVFVWTMFVLFVVVLIANVVNLGCNTPVIKTRVTQVVDVMLAAGFVAWAAALLFA